MAVLREPALPPQVGVRGEPPHGFPVEPNTAAEVDGRLVLWLGPDEWLVLGAVEDDFPDAAAAVDVSANRVAFELTGTDAPDVLAQGCSLDLEPSVFMPGQCAQTLLARAPVIILCVDEKTWVVLPRPSFAPYVRAWLEDALGSCAPRGDAAQSPGESGAAL
jgi:sarcosine oxidase subunit gamma